MLHLITAIVKPFMVEAVKDALKESGIDSMTVTEVQGFGRQSGHTETYRGSEYTVEFTPKVKVEVVLAAELSDTVVNKVAESARTGSIGDGKIWVTAVERVVRIRTAEEGQDAL